MHPSNVWCPYIINLLGLWLSSWSIPHSAHLYMLRCFGQYAQSQLLGNDSSNVHTRKAMVPMVVMPLKATNLHIMYFELIVENKDSFYYCDIEMPIISSKHYKPGEMWKIYTSGNVSTFERCFPSSVGKLRQFAIVYMSSLHSAQLNNSATTSLQPQSSLKHIQDNIKIINFTNIKYQLTS